MSPMLAALALAAVLIASATMGPALLRRSAPALMRAPRTAVMVVTGGALGWAAALIALGPVVAWASTGPALLAGGAGEVCQRCLASASPFSATGSSLAVPAIVPLALAALTGVVVTGGIAIELAQRSRASRRTSVWLDRHSTSVVVAGLRIRTVVDATPYAWTLPARHGGIVMSTGARATLSEVELRAVLAHERAHLRQRHHVVTTVVAGLQRSLGWVPAVRAAAENLPHYVEIAADARAQRLAGTPALASALLVLAAPAQIAERAPGAPSPVLHAAGPERIGRLVGASAQRGGVLSASTVAGVSAAHGVLGFAIAIPYAAAVVSGCT